MRSVLNSIVDALLYDPRDLGMLVVCVIAASLAAAWIVYWFLDRPALERKVQRHEQELRGLRRMAMVDELTGLRNRRALEDLALPEAVRFVRESGKPVGLGFMDFDNFKAANRLGHDAGDELLIRAADRIRLTLSKHRVTDECFRRNRGDEFIFLLPGADIERTDQILRNVLADLVLIGVQASVGAVVAHRCNLPSAQELLRQAEGQMHRVKESGKGRVQVTAALVVAEHDRPLLTEVSR